MAIKLSSASQTQLFEVLFGVGSTELAQVNLIIADGGLIDVSMYMVKVSYKSKAYAQTLTVSTTSLLAGTGTALLKQQACFMLRTFLNSIVGVPDAEPGIVVGMDLSNSGDQTVKAFYAAPEAATAPVATPAPKAIVKGGPVIKLKDATQLGQKVEGTSSGSVYRVVALNDRVKIATRVQAHDLSIRVEAKNPTNEEKVALGNVFSMKSGYGSLHLGLAGLSASKVIGSLLFSLSGMEFDQIVQGAKQVEEANA